MYYFGKDKQPAYERYLREAAALHSGQGRVASPEGGYTVADLCNLYLDHEADRVQVKKITARQYADMKSRLKAFADHVGRDRLVTEIRPIDVVNYQRKLIREEKAANTINNTIASIKAPFHWGERIDLIQQGPRLDGIEKIPVFEVDRQTFLPQEITQLLAQAHVQMRAMILLGLNCGFGCNDCAQLRWQSLDLEAPRVNFPRPKTKVGRNFNLWPTTVAALKAVGVRGELVFYTKAGNSWAWRLTAGKDGKRSYGYNPVSAEFAKLTKRAGVVVEKGAGFYTLRRTGATIVAQTGDVFAVQAFLGHKDLKMASRYVQRAKLTPQADLAIEHMAQWLNQSITNPTDSE